MLGGADYFLACSCPFESSKVCFLSPEKYQPLKRCLGCAYRDEQSWAIDDHFPDPKFSEQRVATRCGWFAPTSCFLLAFTVSGLSPRKHCCNSLPHATPKPGGWNWCQWVAPSSVGNSQGFLGCVFLRKKIGVHHFRTNRYMIESTLKIAGGVETLGDSGFQPIFLGLFQVIMANLEISLSREVHLKNPRKFRWVPATPIFNEWFGFRWFGARWFGILGIPLSNNPFHKGILGIQTTGPQTTNKPFVENWCGKNSRGELARFFFKGKDGPSPERELTQPMANL